MSDKKVREGNSALDVVRAKIKERLKHDDSTVTVAVSGTPSIQRVVGETWVDGDGKQWVRKEGFNESISKLQSARIPLWCPNCKHVMNNRWDTKMFQLYGICFNCTIKFETKLRHEGKWEEYETKKLQARETGYLRELLTELKEAYTSVSNVEFVTGSGTIEKWEVDADKIKKDLESDIAECENRLKVLEELQHDTGITI